MNTDFQGYDALNLPEKSMASNEGKKIILFGKQFDITRSELTAVVLLSLYFFLNWSYFSLFAPFFPVEAVKKGLNETQIGIIFGVLQLVLLFGSPLFGIKFSFLSGIILVCGSEIAFGFVSDCPSGLIYFVMCLVCRIVTGIGASLGYFFPNKIASVVALLEVCTGIGLMVGPVLGGFLFEIGGFKLPFFTMGSVLFLLFIVSIFLFPNPSESTNQTNKKTRVQSLPLMPLLKIPEFLITLLMLFCGCMSINFIEPNIQIHLLPLNLSPIQLGLVFFIPALIYVIVTPFVGYFCDKYPKLIPVFMTVGAFLSVIAYSLLGPLPFMKLPLKLSIFLTGYIIFAISYTGIIIPVYSELNKIAREHGYPNDLRTQGLISGCFGCVHSLGALIGPTGGGTLVDLFGFPMSTFFIVILFILTGIIYAIIYFTKIFKNLKSSKFDFDSESENTLLI